MRDLEDDRPQVVLLDFGMVSRISHEFQDEIIKLLLAISSNRGAEVADACVRMSEVQEGFDADEVRARDLHDRGERSTTSTCAQINVGQLIFNVIAIANNNELKVPAELAMLAKTLLHLDGITRRLDPRVRPAARSSAITPSS